MLTFHFIWKDMCHYISMAHLLCNYEDDGLNAVDFEIMNGVQMDKIIFREPQ